MKTKTKRISIALIVLLVLAMLGGFVYFEYFFTLHLFDDGPTNKVNVAGWSKLEEGMSQQQVIEILGEARTKHGPGTSTFGDITNAIPETWEYNWRVGLSLFGEVHPKAYVVYFDGQGKLASWRAPIETNEAQKMESRTSR